MLSSFVRYTGFGKCHNDGMVIRSVKTDLAVFFLCFGRVEMCGCHSQEEEVEHEVQGEITEIKESSYSPPRLAVDVNHRLSSSKTT